MDTTLTTGTDEAAVEGLARIAHFTDRPLSESWSEADCLVYDRKDAADFLAAIRADPAAARAVRDAIDPDGLRTDAEKWRAAEAEGHLVDFTETGYGLQHPPSCRPDLVGCRFNVFLADYGEPAMEPGRYRMRWTSGDDMPEFADVTRLALIEGTPDAD